jgi:hypothetical protein
LRGSSLGTQSTNAEAGGKAVPHFAVGFAVPDLRPWLGGNCGIPGVWTFTATAPGPHLALVALTHGNEIAGAAVLAEMLMAGIRPECGRLSLIFNNIDAFLVFDPSNPTATRYLDEDLNRLWGEDRLQSPRDSREMRRVRALLPVIESVDVLVDLHSMLWPSDPLTLAILPGGAWWIMPALLPQERKPPPCWWKPASIGKQRQSPPWPPPPAARLGFTALPALPQPPGRNPLCWLG